jgi:CubicO group peptidase (beta-lactamase class C family)
MKKILFSIALFAVGGLAFGQAAQSFQVSKPETGGFSPERLAKIDRMLDEEVAKQAIPGAVALIIRDGKVIYHKAVGFSDTEARIALRKDNIFRIASQSKAITSLAVMMLYEEGKFLLDDPVSKYIPEFKNATVLKTFNAKDTTYQTEAAKGEITIRHLLTHTSGIDYPAIGSTPFKAIYAKARIPSGIGNDKDILADKMKQLGRLPLGHEPGEKWTYGLNTDLLGYLVEIWSGMKLDEFFQRRIFTPLGMSDTYFYLPPDKSKRLVPLYDGSGETIKKVSKQPYDGVNPDYPRLKGTYHSGGAGLSSTTEDYAKFLQLFLNKGTFNGVRLLSRKTVELILTDQLNRTDAPHVGLGFGLETSANDHISILSAGSFSWGGAFNTHYWADPKEKLIGIIYTNVYQTSAWNIGERFKVLTYQAIID